MVNIYPNSPILGVNTATWGGGEGAGKLLELSVVGVRFEYRCCSRFWGFCDGRCLAGFGTSEIFLFVNPVLDILDLYTWVHWVWVSVLRSLSLCRKNFSERIIRDWKTRILWQWKCTIAGNEIDLFWYVSPLRNHLVHYTNFPWPNLTSSHLSLCLLCRVFHLKFLFFFVSL